MRLLPPIGLSWIDACEGEPVEYARSSRTWARPAWSTWASGTPSSGTTIPRPSSLPIWRDDGASLVVALEPLEASQQPSIDRFNRGEIDFDGLAAAIDWAKRWPNYKQYRPVLEAARKAKAPVIGLSPSPEVIRAVVRSGGVDRLDPSSASNFPRRWISRIPSMRNSSRPS